MKVVMVINGLSTGGAEMMLYKLLSRLSHQFSPHVISLTTVGELGQKIRKLGVPVEALGMDRQWPNPLSAIPIIRLLRKIKPDIVHTWLYHSDLLGGVAARIAGVQKVAWNIRNSDLSWFQTKWSTHTITYICALISRFVPTRIVCCSNTAQRIHGELGYDISRFVIIPNGFDLDSFQPDESARLSVRAELKIPDSAPLIGLIARYDPQKGHKYFFDAAGRLHKQRPDVYFILAGLGIEVGNASVKDLMQKAGITEVTRLLGLRNDIARITAALDIASSASCWGEAFPNVVGETMACGIPCVVTDVGDSSYIVGDTGFVVPPRDSESLTSAWNELLTMPEDDRRILGMIGRIRAKKLFELNSVVDRYEHFYLSLVGGHCHRT